MGVEAGVHVHRIAPAPRELLRLDEGLGVLVARYELGWLVLGLVRQVDLALERRANLYGGVVARGVCSVSSALRGIGSVRRTIRARSRVELGEFSIARFGAPRGRSNQLYISLKKVLLVASRIAAVCPRGRCAAAWVPGLIGRALLVTISATSVATTTCKA